MRRDLRHETGVVPVLRDEAQHDDAGQHARDARNAEVDEDAFGDLADRDVHERTGHPEVRRKHGDEEPGIDAEEQHLEDGVERDETRRVLGGAVGELVPDDHHRDAAREADQDETHHVLGLVVQEHDRQREHQHGADDPVLHERKPQHLRVPEDVGKLFVAHLREGRVHHQHQAGRDRDVRGPDLEAVDEAFDPRHEVAEPDAQRHGREDPDGEIPVQERESAGDGGHWTLPGCSRARTEVRRLARHRHADAIWRRTQPRGDAPRHVAVALRPRVAGARKVDAHGSQKVGDARRRRPAATLNISTNVKMIARTGASVHTEVRRNRQSWATGLPAGSSDAGAAGPANVWAAGVGRYR